VNNSKIAGRDIIIVGQQPWDVPIGSNCKNIALEFSKNNRVLYVNSPLDRITSIRNRKDAEVQKRIKVIKGKEKGLIQLQPNLWNLYPDCMVESLNWLNLERIFDVINKWNARKFARSIKKAINELQFRDYLLFNDNEIMKCFYLKELLNPILSIYYSRDYIRATDYWKKHGGRLEPMLIAKSDLCVANSTYLENYCKQYNSNAYYVGQGCELEIFQKDTFEVPEVMRQMKKPVIGYTGALLANRLDIEVIRHIAEQRPEWNIVLIGPEDDDFKKSSLHDYENIYFLGLKPANDLPGYIKAFDVCINPQIVNELTIGNYPRKIDEYLAMGKAVVATGTKAMEIFKNHVHLVTSKEDYIAAIEKVLEQDPEVYAEHRKAFASTHTWENSVAQIYKAISLS
jgi:glycosyltransferase involved in cell wall biosynthesis